jgi:hypothetical protein
MEFMDILNERPFKKIVMALKQRFNIEPNFSMASMTDVFFCC